MVITGITCRYIHLAKMIVDICIRILNKDNSNIKLLAVIMHKRFTSTTMFYYATQPRLIQTFAKDH